MLTQILVLGLYLSEVGPWSTGRRLPALQVSFHQIMVGVPNQQQGFSAIQRRICNISSFSMDANPEAFVVHAEFICARVAIGLEKACLAQMHLKGQTEQ